MFQFVAYTPDPDAQEHVANVQTKGFIDLYWGGGRDGPPSIALILAGWPGRPPCIDRWGFRDFRVKGPKHEMLAAGWYGGLLGRAPVEWVANLREREHGLFMPGLLRFPDSLDQLAGAGDWDAAFIFASGLPGSQLKILCLRSFV